MRVIGITDGNKLAISSKDSCCATVGFVKAVFFTQIQYNIIIRYILKLIKRLLVRKLDLQRSYTVQREKEEEQPLTTL